VHCADADMLVGEPLTPGTTRSNRPNTTGRHRSLPNFEIEYQVRKTESGGGSQTQRPRLYPRPGSFVVGFGLVVVYGNEAIEIDAEDCTQRRCGWYCGVCW